MPSSDYTNAIGGGLKLKGAKDAGVKKHKKKSHKSKTEQPSASDTVAATSGDDKEDGKKAEHNLQKALADEDEYDSAAEVLAGSGSAGGSGSGKTDAQRRHDEVRRKRLDERLQREGVKTHKQRVEELNKYLSRLSEHHDMPRIGPG